MAFESAILRLSLIGVDFGGGAWRYRGPSAAAVAVVVVSSTGLLVVLEREREGNGKELQFGMESKYMMKEKAGQWQLPTVSE